MRSCHGVSSINQCYYDGSCCSQGGGMCNAPNKQIDAMALCQQLGHQSGSVTTVSANLCPESHWDGTAWTSDFDWSDGHGKMYTCVNVPTAAPAATHAPSAMPANKKKRKDNATLLIIIIACVAVVCACGCLFARYVWLAKKKQSPLDWPPSTPATDPTKLHEAHGRMVGWYEAPAQAALRRRWGPFPTRPEQLEAWPGFVPVTNAFMDVSTGPAVPSAPPLPPPPLEPIKAQAVEMLTESPPPPPEERATLTEEVADELEPEV